MQPSSLKSHPPATVSVKAENQQQQLPAHDTQNNKKDLSHLEHIFQSVEKQIEQWGDNAKWKIDLILLDNNSNNKLPIQQQQQQQQPVPPQRKNSIHPLLSPQLLHPNAITTPAESNTPTISANYSNKHNASIPITSTVQYPWDFVTPKYMSELGSHFGNNDLQTKLHELVERQKYLEEIIWSQAEQLRHATTAFQNDSATNDAINTMQKIYLLSQNEQKLQYLTETNMLRADIDKLTAKLKNMAHILEKMEQMEVPAEDKLLDKASLLADRKRMLRKLHLVELRLTARDAEIEYLNEIVHFLKSTAHGNYYYHPTIKLKGSPYLLQQQFSPYSTNATTSEIRSSEPQHPLSALDSLGIVADQMLSDPEFDTSINHKSEDEAGDSQENRFRTRLNDRRSQRSMDSAATLLAMPQLMFPHQRRTPLEHVPKKPRSTYTRWTEAEDKLLRAAVKKYGHSNWEACARDIKGRSNIQCRNRWIPTAAGNSNARQSPSIAALLNSENSESRDRAVGNESPRLHPTSHPYTPPSPMQSPKHARRRATEVKNQRL
ncbi:hypothetical protein BDF20DRAFT_818730 [Mycotypha africana]|uniref:uncharacterized protein n=1 Tax=Mycotypha africana TaxID=64632 RepID=UPI002301EA43|nr:uncharacterized protein BDF20DRAFT_818730 [Mycotypha africana]KAI8981911.1 hypothetical protein BDF20DRAFT_818730 [Mycotypha africana]